MVSQDRVQLRAATKKCMERLNHGIKLAGIAVRGEEPEYAARYLVQALSAVGGELRLLRRAARAKE